MDRFTVIYGLKSDVEKSPSYWWIEMNGPITLFDLHIELSGEPYVTGYAIREKRMARQRYNVRLVEGVKEKVRSLGIMPRQDFSNKLLEYWAIYLEEPVDFRGSKNDKERTHRAEGAFKRLRERAEHGEHISTAIKEVQNSLDEEIRVNNINYTDRVQEGLLRRMSPSWFTRHSVQVAAIEQAMQSIETAMKTLQAGLFDLMKQAQDARCETLLHQLEEDDWNNGSGQAIPVPVREPIRAALEARKVYGYSTSRHIL